MTRYRWDGDRFVNRKTGEPMEAPERIAVPHVVRDVSYKSPLSGKEITSRSQRREEMKTFGVREVAPDEFTPTYNTRKWAERSRAAGGKGEHDPIRKPADLNDRAYQRLSRADLPARLRRTIEKTAAR